ncbi:MAG: 16S rRNA (cytosine(1402)-N(4))-methyltransferase RsmH [Planctomycetota bacterium]|jgi:16S rRNA (cytosine1402-N4)-methyltransferase
MLHVPVMMEEVLRLLSPRPGDRIVDATVGAAGHAAAILRAVGSEGRLMGVDLDPRALEEARPVLAETGFPFDLVHGNFADLPSLLSERTPLDGVLLDLGVNSAQLEDPERGFSFLRDGPLDMRMDPGGPVTAESLVNELPEEALTRILSAFGEERYARRIARRICAARRGNPLKRTASLADIVSGAVPRRGRFHPATRTFQAIRIAVNGEMENLDAALKALPEVLRSGGRAVVISFHSLEDRAVKRAFREGSREGAYELLTRKPLTPTREEIEANPRARSAKLRAVRKTEV